jgi:transposase
MSVPGIAPIISSAMVAAIGAGDAFTKGRDFAAWLGLVPNKTDKAMGYTLTAHRAMPWCAAKRSFACTREPMRWETSSGEGPRL